nr:thiopeptide-type bacteriocin biosynthesis protein [Allomuricauda sp.]
MDNYNFIPGSEWIYLKLYCGKSFADVLIGNVLGKTCNYLINKNLIDKWFFIRFEDPDFHLRFRLHLTDEKFFGETISFLYNKLKIYTADDRVWKVQIEPYQREMNRYGTATIETVESIFFLDSRMMGDILRGSKLGERDRILLGMSSIESFYRSLDLSLTQKIALTKKMRDMFQQEFDLNREQKKTLNRYFGSKIRVKFNDFLSSESFAFKMFPALERRNREINREINGMRENNMEFDERILSSINHMNCNRLFLDRQRIYEMICYDFLVITYNIINRD